MTYDVKIANKALRDIKLFYIVDNEKRTVTATRIMFVNSDKAIKLSCLKGEFGR